MRNERYTEGELLDRSRELIHLFAGKQIAPFLSILDEHFSWLGDYEPLYIQGLPGFLASIREERLQPPAEIRQEEYKLVAHDHSLWVICGRFTAVADTGENIASTVHFTLVWRAGKDGLKLFHAQGTHALPLPSPAAAQSRIFQRSRAAAPPRHADEKISVRDLNGIVHYLFCDEILYIKSDNKQCSFFLAHGSFAVHTTLKELARPPFLLLHRSYLVNARYVRSIRRYTATLTDGTELPIGKERYMVLKATLQEDLPI
ncbi:MAG: LytTR family DNA-binding domain-containing protein [Oscillospiraceae bacterium]